MSAAECINTPVSRSVLVAVGGNYVLDKGSVVKVRDQGKRTYNKTKHNAAKIIRPKGIYPNVTLNGAHTTQLLCCTKSLCIPHNYTLRMPRRTAWASQAELGDLYDMIYAPHADDQSRQKALSRVS